MLALCAAGKLYEVEEWIRQDRPLQWQLTDDRKLQRKRTALQIAVEKRFHSLAALLLANGYDPNGDYYECMSPAVRARDADMVELLLRFGADPKSVDFATVMETCDRALIDRFIEVGVDPCADNATARALRDKRRPILGFVKSYRDRFPQLQRQIDIALHGFTDREDEKGVSLMLWLGADPHAITPSSAYVEDADYVEHESAFRRAMWARNEKILAKFLSKPIPADQVSELFRTAACGCRPDLVQRLLDAGANPNDTEEGYSVLHSFVTTLTWRSYSSKPERAKRGLEALEIALRAGARWEMDDKGLTNLRRSLLKAESKIVRAILDLLRQYGALTGSQMHELTRTAAMARLLENRPAPSTTYSGGNFISSTPRRGYWKRHWSQR